MLNVDINKDNRTVLDFLFEKKSGETYTFFSKHPDSELDIWKKRINNGEIWVDVDFPQAKITSYAKYPPWKKNDEKEEMEALELPFQCKKIILEGNFIINNKDGTLIISTQPGTEKKNRNE